MSNLNAWSKINGTWRPQGFTAVKVGGQWRVIARSFVKVSGVWRTAGLGVPPPRPVMAWHTTGQFRITNYNASFDYVARYANGSGSATLNTSTGIYSLSGANSGFFVSAAYAAGAPRSAEGYMERRARAQSCGNFSACGTAPSFPCNCRENRRALCNEPPDLSCSGCECPNRFLPGASCGCFDGSRCICWDYGPPFCDTCGGGFNYCCVDVNFSGQGYTDRGTEWSKQS
jgi:hypothetical protein